MKLPSLIYLKSPHHKSETYLVLIPNEDLYVIEYQRDFKDNWCKYDVKHSARFSYKDIHACLEHNGEVRDIFEPETDTQYISILF